MKHEAKDERTLLILEEMHCRLVEIAESSNEVHIKNELGKFNFDLGLLTASLEAELQSGVSENTIRHTKAQASAAA